MALSEKFVKDMPKLGFGLMRLPHLDNGENDMEQVKVMVDTFLAKGMKYFDTAYVYDGGRSEEAAKEALVERYPRESFYLATKINAGAAKDEADCKQQLYTSLERTGAGYFDFYLLHALMEDNIQKYYDYHLFEFAQEIKEKGLVKHIGFSFHGTPALLEKLLSENPWVEFVQLQINYADWENPNVASRQCYEIARKHKTPIVVMEPVKGGTLANPPKPVAKVFTEADNNASFASWAIRFVASHEGVMTVLSGMSNTEQLNDNVSYMAPDVFKPLDETEQAVVEDAMTALKNIEQIPCTACHYCTDGCPMKIAIPEIFGAMNTKLVWENEEGAKRRYLQVTKDAGKASECVMCRQCEGVCPQHIEIVDWLAKAAAQLEE